MTEFFEIQTGKAKRRFMLLRSELGRRVFEILVNERTLKAQMVAVEPPFDAMILRERDRRR